MGYRHYMYIVPNTLVNDIKGLTYDELVQYTRKREAVEDWEDEPWVSLQELLGRNEFHEFGKYYENAENIYNLGKPLFENKDTQGHFEDYDPYVVGVDAVLCAIEDYRKKIVKWYSELLLTQEEYDAVNPYFSKHGQTQDERIRTHLKSQMEEWENRFGYCAINTDMDSTKIVRSWLYEYAIFELVHQMKMMDWDNNTIVFYGW
jgi:hypothetical protein